jgi:hypothetical protein
VNPATPRTFLSWAHTGRGWTVDRETGWRRAVIEFGRLLDRYVDVEADFYRSTEAGVDWTRYGPQAIKRADVVVIVGNEAFWERWEGHNPPDEGAGIAREADALHGLFDRDQRAFQAKVVIALLPGEDSRAVPDDLARVNKYPIRTLDLAGVEPLLRRLLGLPEVIKTTRKLVPELPTQG